MEDYMKKLLLALALLSTQVNASQINWDKPETLEAVGQDLIAHYEKSGQKAIIHRLYEDAYGKTPDYIGVTLGSALEKYTFEYIKKNPNAIDNYIKGLGTGAQQDISTYAAFLPGKSNKDVFIIAFTAYELMRKDANAIGLNVTDEELKIIALVQGSILTCYALEADCKFNLIRKIVEYANQQIQK